MMYLTLFDHKISFNGPYKEITGRPLKQSFPNISGKVTNLTLNEQNELRIKKTFHLKSRKRGWPLKLEPRRDLEVSDQSSNTCI